MAHQQYLYLKLLLFKNLQLDLDEFALTNTRQQGLVCSFMGINLASAFQPVLRGDGKVVGREALLRAFTPGFGELAPDAAFEYSVGAHRLVQFDRLVRTIHLLNHARSFSEHELLFLNVHPHLLTSISDHGRTFEQILHYYSVPTSQVVIEIKESAIKDEARLKEAIYNYRSLGYKVALCGFGADYPSLGRVINLQPDSVSCMLKLRPDIVKLDVRLADMAYGLTNIFHSAGTQVIITGIETPEQLGIARNSGADLLQGYYLGHPEFSADARGQLCRGERLAA
ncbi:MAG: EAL domain-containing protein [Nitrosomonadales bacterium]|nr:EAL domain-containing protein [Nitrosomonadales bacterium]